MMGIVDDVRFARLEKKTQEREILDGFLQRLSYKACIQESERPDFRIQIGEVLIGVEITKYFSDAEDRGSVLERTVSGWTKSLDREVFSGDKSNWPTPPFQAGYVEPAEQVISEIVDVKETKASKYDRNFDQQWLVIYAAGLGYHDLCPVLREIGIRTEYFSHIFLWDKFTEKISLLLPYQKAIFTSGIGKNILWVNHLPVPPNA